MEYKGKLYAKIANKYFEISHTDEFEKIQAELNKLIELGINKQKPTNNIIDLAFSIGYDAGYENGKKSTLPQNTEVPQVKY